MERRYWLDLFTGTTWNEFLKAGGTVSGFRESRWTTVQQLRPGDYLLCYLTGVSRWIGILEVTGDAYLDRENKIWELDQFPARVPVTIAVQTDPLHAVPILAMQDRLSIFQKSGSPSSWTGYVRASPSIWSKEDGEAIVAELQEAVRNPVARPFDPSKLAKIPPIYKTKRVGSVTIPQDTDDAEGHDHVIEEPISDQKPREHTEVQFLLLKLGSEMGLDVWAARNDRGRNCNGVSFTSIPRLLSELPVHFDEATNATVELIDVLWLKGKSIIAAFEIESTTSIYSGLLPMSDLIAMQPNLNIPLFLVAPDDRREKVVQEVNRPTFSRLSPPMTEMCRFIPFSSLREQIGKAGDLIRYLRPEFLDEIAETCEVPED